MQNIAPAELLKRKPSAYHVLHHLSNQSEVKLKRIEWNLYHNYLNAIAQLAIVKKMRPSRGLVEHKPRVGVNMNRKIRRIRILRTPNIQTSQNFRISNLNIALNLYLDIQIYVYGRENSKRDLGKPQRKSPRENQEAGFDAQEKETRSSDCLDTG